MFAEARAGLRCVRDLLRFAVSRFNQAGLAFGHGSDNAYDEAAYLILHTLHLPLDRLDPFLDATLLPREVDEVLRVLEQRARDRVPAAYLTGEAWLGDYRFYVDERVIVPRSHIAQLLADRLLPGLDSPGAVRSALDLCTGCGCLAIILAQQFPEAQVDAADLSPQALQVAQRNVHDYAMEGRVRLIESDFFSALAGNSYDLIVSNPPYVTGAAMRVLPDEYRHEPALALSGGEDGLQAVRQILYRAADHLSAAGVLVVEIGDNREALESAFPQLAFTWPEVESGTNQLFLLDREQLLLLRG